MVTDQIILQNITKEHMTNININIDDVIENDNIENYDTDIESDNTNDKLLDILNMMD